MKISRIDFSITAQNAHKNSLYGIKKDSLQCDVFQKSEFNPVSQLNDGSLQKTNREPSFKGFFENLIMDELMSILGKSSDPALLKLGEIITQIKRESEMSLYIETLSDKEIRKSLLQLRYKKVAEMNNAILYDSGFDLDFINKTCEEAKINNLLALERFINAYYSNPDNKKIFKDQSIEAMRIYGLLESKNDFAQFPELLLYLYNRSGKEGISAGEKINTTLNFLKKTGLRTFADFDEKFKHLKSKFNNFDDISDKVDAIEYMQETYSGKISILNDILKANPELKGIDAEKSYASINDIVDYFYEKNDGKSLDGLSDIIMYVVKQNKLKSTGMKSISDSFNNFQTPEDKIEFFRFLKDCNISISDFNSLSGNIIISDIDNLSFYINKDYFTEFIEGIQNNSNKNGFDFYKQFKDIINALYGEDENSGNVEMFIKVADKFNLKNSDSVLTFYNKMSKSKKRTLTSQEIKDFINLFSYADLNKLPNQTKSSTTSTVDYLRKEKEHFSAVKKDIEEFCRKDETAAFAGLSALEIYKKYRDLIAENPDKTIEILHNITNYDIQNIEQYKLHQQKIEPFEAFFKSRENMLEFFANNNIKFGDEPEEQLYRNNCLQIFNMLSSGQNKEISLRRIKYYAESGFLLKSQNKLPEFIKKISENEIPEDILYIIADRKISSLNTLEKFFKQYQSINSSSERNLIEFLKQLPENISFDDCIKILETIQNKLNNLNIPVEINSDNINLINIKDFINTNEITPGQITALLNKIYMVSGETNFLSSMAISNKQKENNFSAYQIALELAFKSEKSVESYQNILRLMGLNKSTLNLPEDCSSYIYANAIEKVLPEKFIDFVNSDDWLDYANNASKLPNLILHARLRAIDRFALNDTDSIETLYTEETKTKLQDLFKTLYTDSPVNLRGSDISKRIITDFVHKSNIIEAVFSNKGEMITIVPKKQKA